MAHLLQDSQIAQSLTKIDQDLLVRLDYNPNKVYNVACDLLDDILLKETDTFLAENSLQIIKVFNWNDGTFSISLRGKPEGLKKLAQHKSVDFIRPLQIFN